MNHSKATVKEDEQIIDCSTFKTLSDELRNSKTLRLIENVRFGELSGGIEMNNSYSLYDFDWKLALKIKENSSTCQRMFCGSGRSGQFKCWLANSQESDRPVMVLDKSLSFKCCYTCPCNNNASLKLDLEGKGEMTSIASISQSGIFCKPSIVCKDSRRDSDSKGEDMKLNTNWFCNVAQMAERVFMISLGDDSFPVRKVVKPGADGLIGETMTDADQFEIDIPDSIRESSEFPVILAKVIGTTIFLDMTYFENTGQRNTRRRRRGYR